MDNNENFERLYNELDDLLRKKYHLDMNASGVYFHESNVDPQTAGNLHMLRELRNYIVHEKRPNTIDACTVTNDSILYLQKMIDKVKKPKRAIDVCVPKEQVLFATLTSTIQPLMAKMLERNISHVPVLDANGLVYGVFSGATMFAYIASQDAITVQKTTIMKQFNDFLPIHKHIGERYWFIAKNAPIEDVIALFGKTMKDGKKLKMLFVTENGKPEERILGLITPWNILDDDVVAI